MNALAKHLARDMMLVTRATAQKLSPLDGGWTLSIEGDSPPAASARFDAVVVSTPAPQAVALLAGASDALAESAANVAFEPCWAETTSTSGRGRRRF